MKRKLSFIFLLIPFVSLSQIDFNSYFLAKSFRFDFMLGGNAEEVRVYAQQMKQEPFWAGSHTSLTDTFNYGTYRFKVFDVESGKLIYSRGFSTLFQEWQTTPEAKKQNRIFYHCINFPFPRYKVRLEIDARKPNGFFNTIFQTEVNPDDYFIVKEPPLVGKVVIIEEHGKPDKKVDLAILSEGYKQDEMDKFFDDARRVTNYLFDAEPFKSAKSNFNVRAVFTPSVNSGTDVPGECIYKSTVFNSSFYTFDIDRYLTSGDLKAICDAAASVPYDHIYVLVNTERYGGGGIYNFLNICSADNRLSREVFVHEFGHGFAGLGDEYYLSSVAYDNFYNSKTEPWEPNITTLVDFESKWQSMIHDSIPVPTPRDSKYLNTVGVFEGGGYQAKGVYSPYIECRMKSNEAEGFCPVCVDAIQRIINFHCN